MKLNNFQLKMIAIFFMTLSHIEYHIGLHPLLYVGQLSFPIFAFLSANALDKTSNYTKYIARILIYGAILQIPIFIAGIDYINIFVTIGLGLVAILFINQRNYAPLVLILIFAYFTNLDYGVYGILIMLISYYFKLNLKLYTAALIITNLVYITFLNEFSIYQWFSLLAIPFIYMYNGKLGTKKFKYFFYIYYPLHIGIILLIKNFL